MLQATNRWTAVMRSAGVSTAYLVELTVQSNGTTYQWCQASRPLYFNGGTQMVPNVVDQVDGVGITMDVLTRKPSTSQVKIVFSALKGSALRSLFSAQALFGQPVTITVGDESLAGTAKTDFLPYWAGFVSDVVAAEGKVTLVCHDASVACTQFVPPGKISDSVLYSYIQLQNMPMPVVVNTPVYGWCAVMRHPLQCLAQVFNSAGLSSILNTQTLNPDNWVTGAYPMGHWNTSRANGSTAPGVDSSIRDPQKVLDLAAEIVLLTGGTFAPMEDGRYAFRAYDPTRTPDDAWTLDDLLGEDEESVKQETGVGTIYNQVACRLAWDGSSQGNTIVERRASSGGQYGPPIYPVRQGPAMPGNSGYRLSIVRNDVLSQARYSLDGINLRTIAESIETKWLGVYSGLVPDSGTSVGAVGVFPIPNFTPSNPAPGGTFRLSGGWISSFCGMPRTAGGTSDGTSNYQVSPQNPLYVLIDDEIIACSSIAPIGNNLHANPLNPPPAPTGGPSGGFVGNPLGLGLATSIPDGAQDLKLGGAPCDALVTVLRRGCFGTVPAMHFGTTLPTTWAPSTAYAIGATIYFVLQGQQTVWQAIVAGTTPSSVSNITTFSQSGPPNVGTTVIDGTVTWQMIGIQQPALNAGVLVQDVTIAQAIVRRVLDRFSDGCAEVTVRAKLHKLPVQLGDQVTFSSDVILRFGLDGVTPRTVWEVIKKTPATFDDPAHVEFRLAIVNTASLDDPNAVPPFNTLNVPSGVVAQIRDATLQPTTIAAIQQLYPSGRFLTAPTRSAPSDSSQATTTSSGGMADLQALSVASGGALVQGTGLSYSIQPLVASRPGVSEPHRGVPSDTVPPSMDTYLIHDAASKTIVRKSVATGAAQPTLTPHQQFLHKLAAGTTTATWTDMRQLGATTASSFRVAGAGGYVAPGPATGATAQYAMVVDRATTNFLPNPSFEVNVTDSWSVVGGIAVSQDLSQHWMGAASANLSITNSATDQGIISAFMAPTGIASTWTINVSAFARVSATGKSARLRVKTYDTNKSLLNTFVFTFLLNAGAGSGVWQRLNMPVGGTGGSLGSGLVYFTLECLNDGTANGVFTLWFDNVQAEVQSGNPGPFVVTTYCDGTMGPNYAWTGTPHNSASTRAAGLSVVSPIQAQSDPFGSTPGVPVVIGVDGSIQASSIGFGNSNTFGDTQAGGSIWDSPYGSAYGISYKGQGFPNTPGRSLGTGTAFPTGVGLATNDVFFRSDLGAMFYWTGAIWAPFSIGGCAFAYYNTATQTLTASSYTVVSFPTKEYDIGSNVSGSVFTAPRAGKYRFDAAVLMGAPVAGGKELAIKFQKNATTDVGFGTVMGTVLGSGNSGLTAHFEGILAATDTIQVLIFDADSVGGLITVGGQASSRFTGAEVV